MATNAKVLPFLLGLILSISLLWPLFQAPFFTHHDDVSIIRLFEMDKCIKDGQIPCRWVPDLGGLYGYPLFNYYAPLPYYFGELIYLLTNNLIISVKVMFAFSFLGSYIFMYLLGTKFWGKLGGSLCAIFYSFAPYHALDFYVRGAMGEMWALMFFPAVLWSLTRLKEQPNIRRMLLGGILIALLILSHNLSAMIFMPIIIIWIIILFLKNNENKFLWFSILSLVFAIMLSSFYLLPLIIEKDLVHVDTQTSGYFGYTEHYKGFRELFIRRDWGFGASIREVPGEERENISFQIGWVHLLGWILALFSIAHFWKRNIWVSKLILVCTILSFSSIFMIHPRSQFIWELIYPLKYLQFPWRLLLVIVFLISFLAGSALLVWKEVRIKFFVLLVFLVVSLNFSYFRPEKFIDVSDKDLLSGDNWERQIKRSIFDFLPIFAKEPPAELADARYKILTGDTQIDEFSEGTNWIRFKANTRSHTIIRLSQYYFPDWKIFVDGKEVKIDYASSGLGLMTIILAKGSHSVEARLYNTPVRNIGNGVSLISFGSVIILYLLQFKKVRNWILYYRKRIN